jgi:hypothetical protein
VVDSYGSDISTFVADGEDGFGLDPLMAEMTGPRVVLEACARRLMTRRGSLRGAPDYGYDLTTRIGARVSNVGLERMKGAIEAELEKDERVARCNVTKFSREGDTYRLTIGVVLATGAFTLVLKVDSVTVEILRADKG